MYHFSSTSSPSFLLDYSDPPSKIGEEQRVDLRSLGEECVISVTRAIIKMEEIGGRDWMLIVECLDVCKGPYKEARGGALDSCESF